MQTHALGAPQARVCTIWETYKLSISTYVSAHLQVYGMHFADANGRPYLSSGGRVSKGAPSWWAAQTRSRNCGPSRRRQVATATSHPLRIVIGLALGAVCQAFPACTSSQRYLPGRRQYRGQQQWLHAA